MKYRLVAFLGLVVLSIAGAAPCDDCLMGRYDPRQSGYTAENLQLPVALDWEYTASKFDNNPAAPVVAQGVCYFATGDYLHAVELATGSLKWRYPATEALRASIRSTPALYGGNVYFGTGEGILYCINAETGAYNWAYQTRGSIRCPPVIVDGTIFFGADDNSLYAIDAISGDSVWPRPFTARDDIATGIAVGSGMVVVSCLDGNIYGINAASGRLRWMPFRLQQAPTATSPVIAENVVIMAVANSMFGLAVRSGQLRWQVTLPSEVAATPALQGTDVYVPCRDKKIYAYNISGRQPIVKWVQPAELGGIPMSSPTVAGDTLFVSGSKGVVAAFSTLDGSLKWRYQASPSPINTPGALYTDAASSPIVANGALLLLTDDGVLRCFKPDAPDNEPPGVSGLTPANGTVMSPAPPIRMSCLVYDIGSGVDYSTVTLSLDGQTVEPKTDAPASSVTYQTEIGDAKKAPRSLKDGVHTITLTARDYMGNLVTREWYFIADSSMQPPRRAVPQEPGKREKEPAKRPERQQIPTPPTPPGMPTPGTPSDRETPPMPPPPPPASGMGPEGVPAPMP